MNTNIPIEKLAEGQMAYLETVGLVEIKKLTDHGEWIEVLWDSTRSPIRHTAKYGVWSAFKADVPHIFVSDLKADF